LILKIRVPPGVPALRRNTGFSRWIQLDKGSITSSMKSCFGLLVTFLVFTVVVGGGALVWYLSDTAEFSRNGPAPAAKAVTPAPRR
jgi:hypothetical protein